MVSAARYTLWILLITTTYTYNNVCLEEGRYLVCTSIWNCDILIPMTSHQVLTLILHFIFFINKSASCNEWQVEFYHLCLKYFGSVSSYDDVKVTEWTIKHESPTCKFSTRFDQPVAPSFFSFLLSYSVAKGSSLKHRPPVFVKYWHRRFPLRHLFPCVFFYSVNKYFAISAKTVTKALKPELQVKASRRFITDVKSQHIKNGEVTKNIDLTTGKEIVL